VKGLWRLVLVLSLLALWPGPLHAQERENQEKQRGKEVSIAEWAPPQTNNLAIWLDDMNNYDPAIAPIADYANQVFIEPAVGYGPFYEYLIAWRRRFTPDDWDILAKHFPH